MLLIGRRGRVDANGDESKSSAVVPPPPPPVALGRQVRHLRFKCAARSMRRGDCLRCAVAARVVLAFTVTVVAEVSGGDAAGSRGRESSAADSGGGIGDGGACDCSVVWLGGGPSRSHGCAREHATPFTAVVASFAPHTRLCCTLQLPLSSSAVLLRGFKWDINALVSAYMDDAAGTLAAHKLKPPNAEEEFGE